jgi:hypothetical protein
MRKERDHRPLVVADRPLHPTHHHARYPTAQPSPPPRPADGRYVRRAYAPCAPQREGFSKKTLIVLLVHVTLLRSFAAIRMLRCLGTLAYRNRQGLPIPGEVEVEAMPSLASVTNVHREGRCTSDSSRFATIRSSPTSRRSKREVWHGCSPRVQGHRRLLSAAHEVV